MFMLRLCFCLCLAVRTACAARVGGKACSFKGVWLLLLEFLNSNCHIEEDGKGGVTSGIIRFFQSNRHNNCPPRRSSRRRPRIHRIEKCSQSCRQAPCWTSHKTPPLMFRARTGRAGESTASQSSTAMSPWTHPPSFVCADGVWRRGFAARRVIEADSFAAHRLT